MRAPKAVGAVRHVDRRPLEQECADYWRILRTQTAGFTEILHDRAVPGDRRRRDAERALPALRGLRRPPSPTRSGTEYRRIVGAGLRPADRLPRPGDGAAHARSPIGRSRSSSRFVEQIVAAINRALAGIPRDRVRMHVCWGNYEGPHNFDVPLEDDPAAPLAARGRRPDARRWPIRATRTSSASSRRILCPTTRCWSRA